MPTQIQIVQVAGESGLARQRRPRGYREERTEVLEEKFVAHHGCDRCGSMTVTIREEPDVALRKHGEGEVIPTSEQQKTAAQSAGMTKEAAEELRRENEAVDGDG